MIALELAQRWSACLHSRRLAVVGIACQLRSCLVSAFCPKDSGSCSSPRPWVVKLKSIFVQDKDLDTLLNATILLTKSIDSMKYLATYGRGGFRSVFKV